jgi:thymidylate synthase (FAD)
VKWIIEPHVHVLSAPVFFDHPEYKLPEGGTPSERLIAHAGKGCYDSYGVDGRSIREHIDGLRKSRHGSVFEHANISVFIQGISRGLSHELVRHRAGFAYSQRSTRYTKEENACFVLEPYYASLERKRMSAEASERSPLEMDESAVLNQFKHQCQVALEAYTRAVEWLFELAPRELSGVDRRKWARGKARQLLPHALETRITMTGNLRAWRFFIEERSGRGAEPEIRRLAAAVMDAIESYAPRVFEDMVDNMETYDGIPVFIPEVAKI